MFVIVMFVKDFSFDGIITFDDFILKFLLRYMQPRIHLLFTSFLH
jgi:hypothetical protein